MTPAQFFSLCVFIGNSDSNIPLIGCAMSGFGALALLITTWIAAKTGRG